MRGERKGNGRDQEVEGFASWFIYNNSKQCTEILYISIPAIKTMYIIIMIIVRAY